MTMDRDRELRAVLAFYQEAGVDALLDEKPVDRLAEDAASPLPYPAPSQVGPARLAHEGAEPGQARVPSQVGPARLAHDGAEPGQARVPLEARQGAPAV